jgi:TPR repeat protein
MDHFPAKNHLSESRRLFNLLINREFEGGMPEFREEMKKLFDPLLESAESGDPEIWYALGDAYNSGWGTKRDREEGKRWYRRAAMAGHARSMGCLAELLRNRDDGNYTKEAIEWFRRAAEAGDTYGMVSLGFAYREGRGVPKDPEMAAEWFIRAHNAGDRQGACLAGKVFYAESRPEEAIRWLKTAVRDFVHRDAYIFLAWIYDDRKSKLYDPAEAVKWYQATVANDGNCVSWALIELARHYRDGMGIPVSKEIARIWLQRLFARERVNSAHLREARKLMEELENSLL